MAEAVFVDQVDAEVFGFPEAVFKADGGEGLQLVGPGQDVHRLDQQDDAGHAFGIEELFEESRHLVFGLSFDLQAEPGLFEEGFKPDVLGEIEEGAAPEVLGEMGDADIDGLLAALIEVGIVEAPVMGEVGANQDDITGFEPFHVVAHELGAAALLEVDQLHFGMEMPFVVDVWYEIAPDAEGVAGFL
jgi:hypothetical protein